MKTTNMAAVYGDDFVYDFENLSDFEEYSSGNEDDLDEIEDEEVDDEEELPYCSCGQPNTDKMIACEKPNCSVQWYHYTCVGFSEKTIPKGKWICVSCKQAKGGPPNQAVQQGNVISNGVKSSSNATQGQETTSSNKRKVGKDSGNKSKKSRITKRPEEIYNIINAKASAVEHFKQSLDSFVDDQCFGIGVLGKRAQKLANEIRADINKVPPAFIDFVVENMWRIATSGDSKGVTVCGQEQIYAMFHQFAGGDVINKWRHLMNVLLPQQYCQQASDLMLQAILSSWLTLIIQDRNAMDSPNLEDTDSQDKQLTDLEQQAVMYVAGYIPYSLLKTYRRLAARGNKIAKDFVTIIESWKAIDDKEYNNNGFINYVKWINLTNRGGLIKPSANLFMFCRCAEGVAQETLNGFSVQTLRDCSIKDIILNKLLTSKSVDKCWERLGSKMNQEQSLVLKKKVLDKWTLVRLNAFLQVTAFLMAKKKLCDKRGAQALRKTVDSS